MKKFLIVLGSLFLVIIILVAGGIAFVAVRGTKLDKESKAYTDGAVPGDIATLLQAGGIQLLDVNTLPTLREFESLVRWGLSRMAHYQKLSDELIVPSLGRREGMALPPFAPSLWIRVSSYACFCCSSLKKSSLAWSDSG